MVDAVRQLDDLARRGGEMADVRRRRRAGRRRPPPRPAPQRVAASFARSCGLSARRARTSARSTPAPRPLPRRAASSARTPTADSGRPTRRTARACGRRTRSPSSSRRVARPSAATFAVPPTLTAAAPCGSSSAPSTSVQAAACRTRLPGSSPAGGGSVTSHSSRVSATTPSPANSSASARPSWPPAPVTSTLRRSRSRQDRRLRAPEVLDPRIGPAEALLVRGGRVVLLGHVVAEEEIGERLEAVRVVPRNVDRGRVVVADVLGEALARCRGRARRRAPVPCRQTKRSSWPRSW